MYMASTATRSPSGDRPQTRTIPFWPTEIWHPVSRFSMLIIDPFRPISLGIFAAWIWITLPEETFPSPGPFAVSSGSLVLSNDSTWAITMSPTSNISDKSRLRGPRGPSVSDAGSIATYGARISTVQPDSPMSMTRPPTISPTCGMYPPFNGTTETLLPSTSNRPTHAEYIWFQILYEFAPSKWSPSASNH